MWIWIFSFIFFACARWFQCYALFLCVFLSSNVLRVYDLALGFLPFKNSPFICCVCVSRVTNCVCSKYSTILFLSRCCRESDAVFYLCAIQIHCCTVACIISISFNQSIACFFDQNQTNNSCSGSDDNNRNSKNVDRMRYTQLNVFLRLTWDKICN